MKSEKLINNVKSKYILDYILDYIKDKNFKDKLFLYSKKLKKDFDINLIGLKENYLNKIGFYLDEYLNVFLPILFEKDCLSNAYNKFLKEKKLDKQNIEKIIFDVYEYREKKNLDEKYFDKMTKIYIESPLFKILSKTKNFGKLYTIYISQEILDKFQSIDEYKKVFDELNNMNINYASIFYSLKDISKINYLKEININFNKIKALTIHNYVDNAIVPSKKENNNVIQNYFNNFFDILFSLNNIENKLIYLNIKFQYCEINPILFEKINNFKSLKYLKIDGVNFEKIFIIKLKVLKILSIISCKNIYLSEISKENLKELYINSSNISVINILKKVYFNLSDNQISDFNILEKVDFKALKILHLNDNKISDIKIIEKVNFGELNELNLSDNEISDINILEKVNFSVLKELDLSNNNISDINILEKVNFNELEELYLSSNKISDINILEKVNFKKLKLIDLNTNKISDISILEKVNFNELNELDLSNNKISDINILEDILEKVNFNELNELDLSKNKISDINILEKVNFNELRG